MKDIKDRIVELCIDKKINNVANMYEEISEVIESEYGLYLSSEQIRGVSRRYRKENNLDESFNTVVKRTELVDKKFTFDFNKDGTQTSDGKIELDSTQEITPNVLLEKHGFDINKFSLVSAKNSIWDSCSGKNKLYSSKIIVKPNLEFVWSQDIVNDAFNKFKISKSSLITKKTNYSKNGKALILPIADIHYQLRSHIESSDCEYDKELAEYAIFKVIEDVLERTSDYSFEKIYFTIGNDMLNCDNKSGSTTKGTPQVNDGEIEKAIVELSNILISCIERLRTVSNVEIIYINSNHDSMSSFGIANALRIRYEDCEDVSVDYNWIERKYKVFGNTLIGFSHDLKASKVNDILQVDARSLLASTTNTVYLLAHLHHEECIEVSTTDVRRLPTISALSRWGYENGYGAVRKNQCFIVDSKYGITDVIYSFV